MKIRTLALALSAMLIATAATAQSAGQLAAQVGARYKDKRYDTVRAALIKQGFQPIRLKHRPYLWPCGSSDYCTRYPEIYDCAGTGLGECLLVWKGPEDSGCFLVQTYGEDKKSFSRIRPLQRKELAQIQSEIQKIYDDPTCRTRLCAPGGVGFEVLSDPSGKGPMNFVIPKITGKELCR